MPINFPNFLNAPRNVSPISGLLEAAMQGYQAKKMPRIMQDEERKRELANALSELQNKYYGPKAEADIASTEATTDLNREKLLHAEFERSLAEMYGKKERELGLAATQADIDYKRMQSLIPKETPNQKRSADLELWLKKQEIINANKSQMDLSAPTKATITSNQSVITAANNIIPQIEELIHMSIPNQITGKGLSPNKYQKYEGATNAIADGLMSAFGWPKTDQALTMAKQLVKRGKLENEESYKERLKGLIAELDGRRKMSTNILTNARVASTGSNAESNLSIENGQMITIRNKRTGQTETVSIEEARMRGAIK